MKFCVDCKHYENTGCHKAKLRRGPSLITGDYFPIPSYPAYEEREACTINPFRCGKGAKWFEHK